MELIDEDEELIEEVEIEAEVPRVTEEAKLQVYVPKATTKKAGIASYRAKDFTVSPTGEVALAKDLDLIEKNIDTALANSEQALSSISEALNNSQEATKKSANALDVANGIDSKAKEALDNLSERIDEIPNSPTITVLQNSINSLQNNITSLQNQINAKPMVELISSYSGYAKGNHTLDGSKKFSDYKMIIFYAQETAYNNYFCDTVPTQVWSQLNNTSAQYILDRSVNYQGSGHRYLQLYYVNDTTFNIVESTYVEIRGIYGVR